LLAQHELLVAVPAVELKHAPCKRATQSHEHGPAGVVVLSGMRANHEPTLVLLVCAAKEEEGQRTANLSARKDVLAALVALGRLVASRARAKGEC